MLAEKLESFFQTAEFQTLKNGMLAIFDRIVCSFQAWIEQSSEVEYARNAVRSIVDNVRSSFETRAVVAIEKRLTDLQLDTKDQMKQLEELKQGYYDEAAKTVKLETNLRHEKGRLKAALSQVDQLQSRLQEVRNQSKKAEKKMRLEESKHSSLLSEKTDLEEKLKVTTKELDALKKKTREEGNTAKKERERDQERIRLLEYEKYEREGDRDRMKAHFDEIIRDSKSKETRAEKERRQAVVSSTGAVERAKTAEAEQVRLMYQIHELQFDRMREEIYKGIAEAERGLRRSQRSCVDKETLQRNLSDLKRASAALDKVISETKVQYDNAVRLIWKGQVLLSHLNLPTPVLPKLPTLMRCLSAQQSSDDLLSLEVASHPAGVIGQSRIGSESATPRLGNFPASSAPYSYRTPSSTYGDEVPSLANDALWSWQNPLEADIPPSSDVFPSINTEPNDWPDNQGDFATSCDTLFGSPPGLFSSSWSNVAKRKPFPQSNWSPPPPYQ